MGNTKTTTLKNLILAVLLVAVLGLFFVGAYYYYTQPNYYPPRADNFVDVDEIKARSASIPPAPDKVCEQPADIRFVSQNYSMCCPNGPKSPNCLCQLPSIKSCQKRFKDCLAGQVFSKESREFLGTENIPDACQKIMDGCAISGSRQLTSNNNNNPLAGMKPDLSNPANSICSIDGYKKDNLAEFCGQVCYELGDGLSGCQYYHTDAIMGSCGLFKGTPVPLEKSAIASSTGNYQLFMTTRDKTETTTNKQTIEGFADDTTPTIPTQGQAAKFCLSGAVDKCLQNKGSSSQDCLCSHSVVNDCRKIHQTCLKSQTSNSNNCRVQFGACCGLVDSTDPNAVASMASKPNTKQGNGKQDDILCSPQQITTLDECKAACLQLDKCDFINSNIIDRTNGSGGGAGAERKGLTNDGLAPFCYLFKGEPLSTPAVMLGQKKGSGKTIYMKLRGNPDELAINSELANEKK